MVQHRTTLLFVHQLRKRHSNTQTSKQSSSIKASCNDAQYVMYCIHVTFDVDIMHKRTSFHLLFISQSCASARAILFLYCPMRDGDGDNTTAATTSYVVSSPSCAGARASFCTVCCHLTMTTHNYAGNKPLYASTRALYFGNDGKEC